MPFFLQVSFPSWERTDSVYHGMYDRTTAFHGMKYPDGWFGDGVGRWQGLKGQTESDGVCGQAILDADIVAAICTGAVVGVLATIGSAGAVMTAEPRLTIRMGSAGFCHVCRSCGCDADVGDSPISHTTVKGAGLPGSTSGLGHGITIFALACAGPLGPFITSAQEALGFRKVRTGIVILQKATVETNARCGSDIEGHTCGGVS